MTLSQVFRPKWMLLSLLLSSALLIACGDDTETPENQGDPKEEVFYFTYKTSEFSISVPNNWDTETSFESDYPDGLRVAFQNETETTSFVTNVSVLEEEETYKSAFDLSQSKLYDHENTLIDYQLLSQEEVTLSIGGEDITSYINTFQGRSSAQSPVLEFQQTYLVLGDKSWIVTGTYLPNQDPFVVEELTTMLKSFSLL